jgi:transcriptional regulator of heat shock response
LGYLNTDPGASNQLALQAKYEYKDYDVNRTAAELFDKDKTALSHYEQEYNELNEQLRRLGDQSNPIILKKRQEIQSRQRALLTEFNKESEDLYAKNRVIAEEAFSDNDKKNQLFKKLYTDKFVQQRVENYAFNNKGKVSVIGETAFMKGKKVEENIRANEEHEWGREKHNAEMKKLVKENTDSQYGLAYGTIVVVRS